MLSGMYATAMMYLTKITSSYFLLFILMEAMERSASIT
jgi:hypothetical protein